MCIIGSNEPKYCACLYANNVLSMYNCIDEKAIKPSCILYLDITKDGFHITFHCCVCGKRLVVHKNGICWNKNTSHKVQCTYA